MSDQATETEAQVGEIVYSKVTGRPAEVLEILDGLMLVEPLATGVPETHPVDRFTRHSPTARARMARREEE